MKKMSKNTTVLQTLQNKMIRVILGLKRHNHNIHEVRKKIGMMSINQLAVYHTLLESYNIVRNSASEQIKLKWTDDSEKNYTLRSSTNGNLKVPEKPKSKCTGFTYLGSKLFNLLPKNIRDFQNPSTFKTLTRKWIWIKIPPH